jgi:Holliday junction resolvase RusA-like endonuclease
MWEIALPTTEIRGFSPETASSNKIKRKKELKKAISKEIGKQHQIILKMVKGKELFIDVCFYLYLSEQTGSSKKDLDNLLKILLDVLSANMVNGQKEVKGLGFLSDDSLAFKIHCEKKITHNPKNIGLDLKILYR